MRVAVIGGGIQGSCVAMELAMRGGEVDLIESKHQLMDGASRHTEGKIHLGFVFAKDPTLKTADLMMKGAFSFAPLMQRWLGSGFADIPVSPAFDYVVHCDSLVPTEQLESVYLNISTRLQREQPDGAYFGVETPHRVTRLSSDEVAARYGSLASAVFATEEVAIDPEPLADLISRSVADNPQITVRLGTSVTSVEVAARSLIVHDSEGTGTVMGPYDHVINCAWHGRLAIDVTVGLTPPGPWSFRMKYFVRLPSHPGDPSLPTATIVLGAFGEFVDYGAGDYYLSWYPIGRRGWSSALQPPPWPTRPDAATAKTIARETVANLSEIIPSVGALEIDASDTLDVRGGVIYALGTTDISDPDSKFHRRSKVGITTSDGWYHSVDTGKYTTAPLFAMQTADRITGP